MPQLALSGGFYESRSLIASAQRCINLYPEKNPPDAVFPFTMYQTPGLTVFSQGGASGTWGRGFYLASNGKLFIAAGDKLYYVASDGTRSELGTLLTSSATPVRMQDNGTTLIAVDGPNGYTVDISSLAFANYSDPNFLGADYVGFADGFLVFNQPDTKNWYQTEFNSTTIDPLAIAAKFGYPDNIAAIILMHLDAWLLGEQQSTEIWNNVGSSPFAFARQPGIFIEHGCAAKYSVAKHDLLVFWLGIDAAGERTVFMGSNYAAKRISTDAIAAEFGTYETISDAVAYTYKQLDHIFYVINFPSADKTWVYDVSQDLWHERTWTDGNGDQHRHRVQIAGVAYGKNMGIDWENGTLYYFDLANYTDNGGPIMRYRSFPTIAQEGDLVSHTQFTADFQAGEAAQDIDDVQVDLIWSNDHGRTWGTPISQGIGLTGAYGTQANWNNLGVARWRVYALRWSAPVKTALNGSWVMFEKASA